MSYNYIVSYSTNQSGPWTQAGTASTASFTINNLSNGNYYVQVIAVDTVTGLQSSPAVGGPFTVGSVTTQQESPDQTSVTSSSQTIFSSKTPGQPAPTGGPFDTWSITGQGGQVVRNGVADPTTSALLQLYYLGHVVYQRASNGNSFGTPGWWSWTGTTWADAQSPIGQVLSITGISLSNSIITAGAPAGTVVGTLAVSMSFGSFSGTLALGGANASSFSLSGSNTVVTTPASFPTGNFSLAATATQASASNSPFTTPQPFSIVSQSASSGPGPAASSSFITADFTSPTGRTAPKELFGVATGGLGNNFWQTVSGSATLRNQIKALNLPLIRLHSGWMQGNNTFSSNQLSGLVSNLSNIFPPGIKIILGIQTSTLNNSTFFNYTRDAVTYWKNNAPSGYPLQYVECMNEVDFSVSGSTYASCFAGMVDGAQSVDPTIRGTGSASAGLQDRSQRDAVIAQYNATTGPQKVGFFNHHQYLYCFSGDPNGSNNKPDDVTVMTAGFLPPIINGTFNETITTWTKALPAYALFEFSIECGANFAEDRTQTSRGACFLLSYWMKTAEQTTACLPWSGCWDLFDDQGANYNWIYTNLSLGAQYYLAQRAIAKIPGNLCRITTNGQSNNLLAWATVSGSNFSVPFVNLSNNPISGSVALSHWPVNSTGSGTVKFYSYPTTDSLNTPGTETNVSVTNGLTSSITVQPRSWAILST